MRHEATFDWVERETGDPYRHPCAEGHAKVVVGELKEVNGHLAAMMECTRCGLRGFHWIPEEGSE